MHFKNFVLGIAILSSLFLGTACVKSNSNTNNNNGYSTVVAAINSASNLKLLQQSLRKTGLDVILSGTGPYTMFVPTDQAFSAYGLDSVKIAAMSKDTLSRLLLYHVLDTLVYATNFPTTVNAGFRTASGDSLFSTVTSNAFYVNGIQVIQTDVVTGNGLINAVTNLLVPPSGNFPQVLAKDTIFSYLVAAINHVEQNTTNGILDDLSNGRRTLFAPINGAFRNAGFADVNAINSFDADSLRKILLYHILPGRTFTSQLSLGGQAVTLADSTLLVLSGSNPTIKGDKNSSPANILGANTLTTTGVLHIIDQVLIP